MSYLTVPPEGADARSIARVLNNAMQGKINAVMTATLTPSVAATDIVDPRITAGSFIGLCPLSANAAGALATTYVSARVPGTATLTHANNAQTDRYFVVLVIG